MVSDEPTDDRCNARAGPDNDGYCEGWAMDNGRCYRHGGATPTKKENPNVGARKGNERAVGNPGGGAPEGNQNAMKTGLYSDPVGLFEYLEENEPEAARWIIAKLIDFSEDAPFAVFKTDVSDVDSFDEVRLGLTAKGDELFQTCIRDYARWRAAKRQLQEGIITERMRQGEHGSYQVRDSNPVNLDLDRMDRAVTKARKDLGVTSVPTSAPHALESRTNTTPMRGSDGQ